MISLGLLLAAATLVGETSNPAESFFARGSAATITLTATDFAPNATFPLTAEVLDHEERPAGTLAVPASFTTDAAGAWHGTFALPTARYGFFKVRVASGEVALAKVGTRPAGFLTYAVAHDPAERPEIAATNAFFGSFGDGRWLGCRQRFQEAYSYEEAQSDDGKVWGNIDIWGLLTRAKPTADDYWGKFYTEEGRAWLKATEGQDMRTLVLTTETGERHYRAALANLMRQCRKHVRKGYVPRLYAPYSEVDINLPTAEMTIKFARILRETLDAADPEGLTCFPGVSRADSVAVHRQYFEMGLGTYLNAFAIHPYTAFPPEPNGFLQNIREIVALVRANTKGEVLLLGTEAGCSVAGTKEGELLKLNGQIRQNLILLGEGFAANYNFYGVDFGGDYNDQKDGDYGMRYNLTYPDGRYSMAKTSPRAIAAGLAAATWILDGKRPTACLEGTFGDCSLGYAFADVASGTCALALWDYGAGCEAKIPVGRAEIAVADIMGNETTVATADGVLTLTLGASPVYVLGPDPALWGKNGTMAAQMAEESRRRAAERAARIKLRIASAEPAFRQGVPALRATIENRTDQEQKVVFKTRLKGDPRLRKAVTVTVPARTTRPVEVVFERYAAPVDKVVKLHLEASIGDVFTAERDISVNFWRAPRNLGENPVRYPVGDGTCRMAFGWDDGGLVGDIVVEDAKHVNEKTGFWSWNGDALQMGFAKTLLDTSTQNSWTDLLLQAPSEYTFALTPNGPEVYRTSTYDYRIYPAGMTGGEVSLADCPLTVTHAKGLTRYRYHFPWKFLNFDAPPPRGTTIRLAAFVNKTDDPFQKPVENMRVFELKENVPAGFGRIVLD